MYTYIGQMKDKPPIISPQLSRLY